MSSLFIFGNGFDLAHGIPSEYNDFRSFIIEQYPNALEHRDEVICLEGIEHIDLDEFAAEILLNTMDRAAGCDWHNFEEALALIDFDEKLPRPNHKENETPEEDHKLMEQHLLYLDALTDVFIDSSKWWEEFFRFWLNGIQKEIDNGIYAPKDHLAKLFSESDAQFMTFNYTKTLQRLYKIPKVIHIHNRVGQKLVWGHEKENVSYAQFSNNHGSPFIMASSLNEMLMSFKKNTERPLKKYEQFFKKLDFSVDRVYSYGFSSGKADSVYIKKIISKINPSTIWYFTAYEASDKEALQKKKVKLRRYGFKGTFKLFDG